MVTHKNIPILKAVSYCCTLSSHNCSWHKSLAEVPNMKLCTTHICCCPRDPSNFCAPNGHCVTICALFCTRCIIIFSQTVPLMMMYFQWILCCCRQWNKAAGETRAVTSCTNNAPIGDKIRLEDLILQVTFVSDMPLCQAKWDTCLLSLLTSVLLQRRALQLAARDATWVPFLFFMLMSKCNFLTALLWACSQLQLVS